MSAPDLLYGKAWHGLREALRTMAAEQSGTAEHVAACAQAAVWMDVLVTLCPERTAASIMGTALARLSDAECRILQASV